VTDSRNFADLSKSVSLTRQQSNKDFTIGKEAKVSFIEKNAVTKAREVPGIGHYNISTAYARLSAAPSGSITSRRR
jgi:hypothetical protein